MVSNALVDTEAARRMQEAKRRLFAGFEAAEKRPERGAEKCKTNTTFHFPACCLHIHDRKESGGRFAPPSLYT
jgi:hypothetical protein